MSAGTLKGRRWPLFVWELVLCWVAAACCAQNASMAFLVGAQVTGNLLWALLLPGVALALLELGTLGGRFKIIGPLAAALVAALFVAAAMQGAPTGDILADTADNPLPFVLLSVAIAVVVFLLSRTCSGSVLLAVLTVLLVAAIEFLYEQSMATTAAGALLAVLGLVVLARFKKTTRNGACGECSAPFVMAGSAALCLLAFLLAFGGYVLLSSSVDLPKAELKLITKEMALEEIEVEGITNTTLVYDENRSSKKEQQSDWLSSLAGDQSSKEELKDAQAGDDGGTFNAVSGVVDPEAWATTLSGVRYEITPLTWVLLVILVLAVIAASIALKRFSRRKRLEKMLALPAQEQACELFRSFLLRAERIGIRRREEATLEEFKWESTAALERLFEPRPGLMDSFDEACRGFSQAYYGYMDPSPLQLQALKELYEGFCPCAVAYLGRLRYAFKFFRL